MDAEDATVASLAPDVGGVGVRDGVAGLGLGPPGDRAGAAHADIAIAKTKPNFFAAKTGMPPTYIHLADAGEARSEDLQAWWCGEMVALYLGGAGRVPGSSPTPTPKI